MLWRLSPAIIVLTNDSRTGVEMNFFIVFSVNIYLVVLNYLYFAPTLWAHFSLPKSDVFVTSWKNKKYETAIDSKLSAIINP